MDHCALPACDSHSFRQSGIGADLVHGRGKVGFEADRVFLVVMHQKPGLAVLNDLGDAAHIAGDDCGFASHGLQIHDAEGFID